MYKVSFEFQSMLNHLNLQTSKVIYIIYISKEFIRYIYHYIYIHRNIYLWHIHTHIYILCFIRYIYHYISIHRNIYLWHIHTHIYIYIDCYIYIYNNNNNNIICICIHITKNYIWLYGMLRICVYLLAPYPKKLKFHLLYIYI